MSRVTAMTDFLYYNLAGTKQRKLHIELERLLDPMAREVLGASKGQGLGQRLNEFGQSYYKVAGDVGEAISATAMTLADYENVAKPEFSCYDLEGTTTTGKTLGVEVKTMAAAGYGTRFASSISAAQLATLAKGGPHVIHLWQLERVGDDIAGLLGLSVDRAKVSRLYRNSGQNGNPKYSFHYNYAGGRIAHAIGATKKRMSFDQVVEDLRAFGS